jgi:hypothetical protein
MGDRYDRTVRQLKVAAGLGSTNFAVSHVPDGTRRSSRRASTVAVGTSGMAQLKALTNQPPQETPPVADTPIQRVLEDINTLPLPTVEGKVIAGLVTGNVLKAT